MCGIVGVFGPQASEVKLLKSVELLLHRGPDSHSVAQPNDFLSLGAARLAMTDPLPRSNQPFEKNGNWIVFNGEIYNHHELREWLKNSQQINFVTNSDTEVLLEILRIFGADGVRYLNGMFAFAYFDKSKQKLILGRDRLGKKPFYYSTHRESFYWASTIPALRQMIESQQIDQTAILSYLAFGYTIDPLSIYEGIRPIEPGHCYEIQAGKLIRSIRSPIYEPINDGKKGVTNLVEAIEVSISDRIEGHQGIAISLSGGLDSSIVAKSAAQSMSQVVAYSLRWGDSDKSRYNTDFEAAETIAKNLNLKFVGVDFSNGDRNLEDNLIEFVRFMGEPNSNPSGVSLVPLYRKISEDGFRLVLTGDGSDEIFGGYPRYESPLLRNNFRFLNDKQIISLINANDYIGKLGLRFANSQSPGLWANFHWNFKPTDIERLVGFKVDKGRAGIAKRIFSLIEKSDFRSLGYGDEKSLQILMERDSSIWLTNESNRKLDRISMAFSIEARSPFQDERVIEIGKQEMRRDKYRQLNKKILWNFYPELKSMGVRSDKAGFISPVGHWLRTNPKLVNTAFEALIKSGLFEKSELVKRHKDQYSAQFDKIRQLWSLVVLGYWLKTQDL